MHATGNASTTTNLMTALSAFAVANAGFTQTVSRAVAIPDPNGTGSTNPYNVICLSKGTDNFWFAFSDSYPLMLGFHSLNRDGVAYGDVSGVRAPGDFKVNNFVGPFTSYDFFTEGTVVHCAAQMSSGAYQHFTFGNLTKYGTWTGGAFMLGSESAPAYTNDSSFNQSHYLVGSPGGTQLLGDYASHVYIPFGSRNYGTFWGGLNAVQDQTTVNLHAFGNTVEMANSILRDQPNAFNNRATGVRMEVFLADNVVYGGNTNLWLPIGYVPNLRAINITNLNARDVVNNDWMVFPLQSKTGIANVASNTFGYGWAVKQ